MRKFGLLFIGLLLALALGTTSQAQRERWTYLGDARVDGGLDHDSIHVGITDGKFRAIQLRVNGGAVEFDRVIVHFGNGSEENLAIHQRIPSGGRTGAIDLPGDRRIIQSVEMWYSKARWEHRPKVTLYGIR
jgi:hypothetical protein